MTITEGHALCCLSMWDEIEPGQHNIEFSDQKEQACQKRTRAQNVESNSKLRETEIGGEYKNTFQKISREKIFWVHWDWHEMGKLNGMIKWNPIAKEFDFGYYFSREWCIGILETNWKEWYRMKMRRKAMMRLRLGEEQEQRSFSNQLMTFIMSHMLTPIPSPI